MSHCVYHVVWVLVGSVALCLRACLLVTPGGDEGAVEWGGGVHVARGGTPEGCQRVVRRWVGVKTLKVPGGWWRNPL